MISRYTFPVLDYLFTTTLLIYWKRKYTKTVRYSSVKQHWSLKLIGTRSWSTTTFTAPARPASLLGVWHNRRASPTYIKLRIHNSSLPSNILGIGEIILRSDNYKIVVMSSTVEQHNRPHPRHCSFICCHGIPAA